MKKVALIVIFGVLIMIAATLSGCTDSSGDDDDDGDDKLVQKGKSWTYKVTDDTMGIGSIKMTVTNEASTFDGQAVMIVDMEMDFEPYHNEEDEIYYGDTVGTGKAYLRTTDFENVFIDSEMIIVAREDPGDEWSNTKYVTKATYTTTGTIPDEIKTGVVYSLEEATEDDTEIYVDDTLSYDEVTTYTETKKYEVLGEKEITVPAGTFNCFEIKVYTVDNENDHTLKYFSPELNIDVKIINHLDGDVSSTNELQSYSK